MHYHGRYISTKNKQLPNELYHYGIIGQKWGIRRYQNPDGSYTEEGKRRYNTVQAGSAVARGASLYSAKRASEIRSARDDLVKRYTGKAGEKRYLEDTYGKTGKKCMKLIQRFEKNL